MSNLQHSSLSLIAHKLINLEDRIAENTVEKIRNANGRLERAREDLRLAEKKALEAAQRYEKIFRYSSHGIALVGLEGHLLAVNDAACRIWERRRSELKQLRWQDITREDYIERDDNLVNELAHGDVQTYDLVKPYIMPDGKEKWCLLSVTTVDNEQGTPIYFISQIQDLSRAKQLLENAEKQIGS